MALVNRARKAAGPKYEAGDTSSALTARRRGGHPPDMHILPFGADWRGCGIWCIA
jgi:hypothetical protein